MLLYQAGEIFFSALMISVLVTPLTIRMASRLGAIDHPDGGRKLHSQSLPRLGGLGIALAFLVSPLGLMPHDRPLLGLLGGIAILMLTGLVDDLVQMRPVFKLLAQIAAAACFVIGGGVTLTSFGNLLGWGPIETGAMAPWITIFCIVGVINAMNLCDGLDGLAAGYTVIACMFLSILSFDAQDWPCLLLLLALMGGSLGFLRYNTYPARLFMGDVGSMVLGYGLATSAVLLAQFERHGTHPIAPITLATILALPILDTLVVMFRRMLRGRAPFSADRTHLHHRLIALGLPHDQAVMMLYAIMALFGCLAFTVRNRPEWVQFDSALALAIIMFATLTAFEHMRGNMRLDKAASRRQQQAIASPTSPPRMGWLHRNTLSISLLTLFLLAFVALTSPNPSATIATMLTAVLGSVLLLYPWHPDREHAAIQKGVIYLMVAALFLYIHLHAIAWQRHLLAVLAVLAVLLVLARATSWSTETHGSSSFQVLILLNMAIIPLALLSRTNADNMEHIVFACLEAIPVAWVLNGYSVQIYQRNRNVTLMLMGILALVLLKSGPLHGWMH